jgi:tetratricopeptide (TPR) repeat protein
MNTNLLHIVKQIIAQNGENILADAARLKPLFADLAKNEPKPLRIAFGRCVEAGAYTALKTASGAAERASRKAAIAQNLRNQHGVDPALCGEALDILEAALFGTASPPHTPKKKTLRNVLIAAGVAAVVIVGVVMYQGDPKQKEIASLLQQGRDHFTRQQYDKAIAAFSAALRLAPDNAVIKEHCATAYHNRGTAYFAKGDDDRAIADFNEAMRLADSAERLSMAYAGRGWAYTDKGDYKRAYADFSQALLIDPNNAVALQGQAQTFSLDTQPYNNPMDWYRENYPEFFK